MSSSAAPSTAGPIRIFRTGTFTSVEGTVVSFTAEDLAAIASSYDPAVDPAPLVIGHPKLDDPAFGWAGALSVEGDVLVATPDRVEPAFAEMVNAGRFGRISAQFYPPDNANNPKPGSWYLKHIGFLGAAAPAVKGLGVVSLSDGDAGPLITIDQVINQHGIQEKTMSDPKEGEGGNASFAERETALNARETALKDREAALAKRAAADRHDANVSFAEGMVADGKLGKAGADLLVPLLDAIGGQDTVSFGEGDANQLAPDAALKKLLGGAKPLVSLGEAAPADRLGAEVDPTKIAAEAQSFAESEQKAGRTITIAAAVRHVMNKGA